MAKCCKGESIVIREIVKFPVNDTEAPETFYLLTESDENLRTENNKNIITENG